MFDNNNEVNIFQAKIESLQREADAIEKEKPAEAEKIRDDIRRIQHVWDILNRKVREHEAKLDEAGDLQRFLRDLDHFQAWLTATQRQVSKKFTCAVKNNFFFCSAKLILFFFCSLHI